MKSFLAGMQFLTLIPIHVRLEERDFERAPIWFPFVGLLLGVPVALADALLAQAGFPAALRGVLPIGLLAALSGGLHLDGLADSADGLLSARPRVRVLEIMHDSRIGTMGVLALIFVLGIKMAALCELTGATRWRALLFAPLAGRCLQLIVMGFLPYARGQEGMAAVFIRRHRSKLAAWAVLWLLAGAMVLFGLQRGAACVTGVIAIAALLSLWLLRRIGGFTGDTLGATSEMTEAAVLLVACVN